MYVFRENDATIYEWCVGIDVVCEKYIYLRNMYFRLDEQSNI